MPELKQKSQPEITNSNPLSFGIVIVSAGRGERAGGKIPKQYQSLAGKPLLWHTLKAIRAFFEGVPICLVIHPGDAAMYEPIIAEFSGISLAVGGKSRQESVFAGLKTLQEASPDTVLVHDAARPFVSEELMGNILNSLAEGKEAVIPALKVTDTLKRVENNAIQATVSRDGLYCVQTPQAFSFPKLLTAHQNTRDNDFTDDAAVYENAGHTVHICEGDEGNFKVTNPTDFQKAEACLLQSCPDIRTGSGYDVHAFEDGDHVIVCGVKIPHTHSLKGHSDADVGLHALTDALLSSIAAGDIGTHFPPSDNQWKGAESHVFLRHAAKLLRDKGGIISNLTVLIICEKPKIGPHAVAMRNFIADTAEVDVSRVSVQATTSEQLGFTGRGEGMAAQATATVRLPLGH